MQQRAVIGGVGNVPVDPQYVQGGRADELWAHFRSGAVVQASRCRTRHYPGLCGAAPATLGLYVRADELRLVANHVIDAGCGSGEGLRHLRMAYRRATGIDREARALAFARQFSNDCRFVQSDLELGAAPCEPAQVAYCVDVLGHLAHPERALHYLTQRLDAARGLVVAEPVATADQCLTAPARRAFSLRGLHSTLVRGGFALESWLSDEPPFLLAHAVAHRDKASTLLLEAEALFEKSDITRAEQLAVQATRTSLPALKLEALLALARIQIEQSRRDAATASLLEARTLDPGDARTAATLSRLAMLAGSESKAFALAREACRLELTEVAAATALALLTHEADPKSALNSWLVAHALAPDHAGIAGLLCECALRVGDTAVAITVLERVRRYASHKDAAPSAAVLAWLLAGEGRALQAEIHARLAETLDPNSPDIKDLREFLRSVAVR